MINNCEIAGIQTLALYINKDVDFKFPNPAKKKEVNLIAHAIGSFTFGDSLELPTWRREIEFSANKKLLYSDTFTFFIHGIENEIPEIIEKLRNSRVGFIAEIITKGNKSFVFPAPVFVNKNSVKKVNSHSWAISLTYAVPTVQNYYIKLNTILMNYSYIYLGGNSVLGASNNLAITSN